MLDLDNSKMIADIALGATALIMVLILVGSIVYLLNRFFNRMPRLLQRILLMIKSKLMWNSILRYAAQSYLSQAIAVSTSMAVFTTLSMSQKILTPLVLTLLALIPASFAYLLHANRGTLHTPETKQKYGSLYMNYETDKASVVHFTSVFLYRRLFFAFVIAFCRQSIVV